MGVASRSQRKPLYCRNYLRVRVSSGRDRGPRRCQKGNVMTKARFETIVYEKSGVIATLTLNRPERMNGMTNRMVLEAGEALAQAAEDRDVRVLVLTGAGKSFCPGADLNVVASG